MDARRYQVCRCSPESREMRETWWARMADDEPAWAPRTVIQDGSPRYVYSDRDGAGVQDPAIRAYGCAYVGQVFERDGPWWRGKALVRAVATGELVVVRARLLRRIRG